MKQNKSIISFTILFLFLLLLVLIPRYTFSFLVTKPLLLHHYEYRDKTRRCSNKKYECSINVLSMVKEITKADNNNNLELASTMMNPSQLDAIHTFASQVSQSILESKEILSSSSSNNNKKEEKNHTTEIPFISFKLFGPKGPKKKKNISNDVQRIQIEREKSRLLGRMKEVSGRLISLRDKKKSKGKNNSNTESLYLQLTIKYFGATDVAKNWDIDHNIEQELVNLIIGKGDQSTLSEWGDVGNTLEMNFLSGQLQLNKGIWTLDLKQKAKCSFTKSKLKDIPTKSTTNKNIGETLSHDKPKNVLLSPSAQFFQRLGLTDSEGKPKQAKSSKLRQCQKFVEVVSGLVNDSLLSSHDDGHDFKRQSIVTHDMGCGRGYLTFALHSHLYKTFHEKLSVHSLGVDMRPKLVKEINNIASELGPEFEGLRFETGTIESTQHDNDIDILIALHACDTATDDSIFYGVQRKASIIVTAPCCHKEVRRYLNAHVSEVNDDHPYSDVLRHNIYKERIAETVTDSLRALLLEIADYDVQVFEFIGGEHTNKNVMITATKRKKARSPTKKKELRERLISLSKLHGVHKQKLATLMKEPLSEDNIVSKSNNKGNTAKVPKTGMPPL